MEGWGAALIGFLGVVAGGVITGWWQRRKVSAEADKLTAEAAKTKAEADDLISKTVMSLIQPLKDQICTLRQEIANLEQQNAALEEKVKCYENENGDLKAWAEVLVKQVILLKGSPAPFRQKART